MSRYRIFLILFFLGFRIPGNGQISDSLIMLTTLEKMTEINEEEPDYQIIAEGAGSESLRAFSLSAITEKRLRRLSFLSDKQIENILSYLEETGQLLSVYELQSIQGLDTGTIRKLLPYLSPGDPNQGLPVSLPNLMHHGRHELMLRWGQCLEQKKGYRAGAYEGTASKDLFRYTYTFSNRIKAAITGEKDAGEKCFGSTQPYGMDFYSGYIALTNTGFLKSLIIGNFTASFGQGIVAGTGSGLGSVIGFNAPLRVSQGVKPSSSAYEGSYQQGVAVSMQFRRFLVSGFISGHDRDATVLANDTITNKALEVSSLQNSGYHRTPTEIAARDVLKENITGGNITFTGRFFRIGATALHAEWDGLIRPPLKPYNRWYFRGNSLTAAGMDIVVRFRYISLFAEAGNSLDGAWAWIAGLSGETEQGLLFSITARNYDPAYTNIFSNSLGQATRTANEQGCLLNVNTNLFPDFKIAVYTDLFRHPWLRYRVNNPSAGLESGLLWTYTGCRTITFSGKAQYRGYDQNSDADAGLIATTSRYSTAGLRLQADWQGNDILTLKTQVEVKTGWTGFTGNQAGYLAGQEIRANLPKQRLQVSFRYALFDIPSWDLRIYSYEPDVMASFAVPAYDGKGLRVMVTAKGRITRHLSWWIKYGVTWYEDKTTIGSGLEEINGNRQSEAKAQVVLTI